MHTGVTSRLVATGLAVAFCAAASGQSLREGQEFPNFEDKDLLTGEKIALQDFRGKVVLVDFWATWCPPCRAELPHVKEAYQKFHERGLEIIGISLDGDINQCKKFVQDNGMAWRHIADGKKWDARLARQFGINAIPAAFLVGRDGKIVAVKPRGPELLRAIEKALGDVQAGGALPGPSGAARGGAKGKDKSAGAAGASGEALKELAGEDAKKADSWLQIARSMAANHNYRLARKYYQRIVDTYSGTTHAKKAQDGLAGLPNEP